MRVGVDIGGTKIEAVAVDEWLNVVATYRGPARHGAEAVTAGTLEAVREMCRRTEGTVESVGIGVPGAIRHGVVQHARNISIGSFDLKTAIAEATDATVRVCNDVNAAALGAWALHAADSSSFVYLNLGTGMAAGLVLNGHVWEGNGGVAGEIGYILGRRKGPRTHRGLGRHARRLRIGIRSSRPVGCIRRHGARRVQRSGARRHPRRRDSQRRVLRCGQRRSGARAHRRGRHHCARWGPDRFGATPSGRHGHTLCCVVRDVVASCLSEPRGHHAHLGRQTADACNRRRHRRRSAWLKL